MFYDKNYGKHWLVQGAIILQDESIVKQEVVDSSGSSCESIHLIKKEKETSPYCINQHAQSQNMNSGKHKVYHAR